MRTTIDFGIDLGTTNSAIALLKGTSTEIIKNNDDRDITASAVHINKHGAVRVGYRAKSQLEREDSSQDVYIEFKRRMGTTEPYAFKSAEKAMLPEELSAELLTSLRGNVQQRLGEEVQAAVITVPAAFELRQTAATRRAGELAGLTQCPLVQEPVAAALAYGFQSEARNEYWLVYDFGGGTFDAAIMRTEDGTISVVNHGGDNHLGGSEIDWAIIDQLVLPYVKERYGIADIARGAKRWVTALAKIKGAVETAKIELSRVDVAQLEDCRFGDSDGDEVDLEDFSVTRSQLVAVAEPIIMRSIEICRRTLKEKNLTPASIERVLLVGGPTLAPYFREIIQANLAIPLDFSVDPLTVVARGAAVFAGTQKLDASVSVPLAPGVFKLDLAYQPIGADEDPTVRGTVSGGASASLEGYTIEFVNTGSDWRSGRVSVNSKGRFKLQLLAQKGRRNEFLIELRNPDGQKAPCAPDMISYTVGLAISEQPLTYSIGVALANNDAEFFFHKGEPLPARATKSYRSTHAIRRQASEDILQIPVVEGENPRADRNKQVGNLVVMSKNISRDLPANSEVEVRLEMKVPDALLVKAYVPFLDEEFEAEIRMNDRSADPRKLQDQFEEDLQRLENLRASDNGRTVVQLDGSLGTHEIRRLEDMVSAAKADPDIANQAEAALLEFRVTLDELENAQEWPTLAADADGILDELEEVTAQYGNASHRDRLGKMKQQIESLVEDRNTEGLRRAIDRLYELQREILVEQPGFWLGFFEHLQQQRSLMTDAAKADQLFNQGRRFVDSNDLNGLKNVVRQLLQLVPEEQADTIQKGFIKSGIQR